MLLFINFLIQFDLEICFYSVLVFFFWRNSGYMQKQSRKPRKKTITNSQQVWSIIINIMLNIYLICILFKWINAEPSDK